MTKYKLIVKYDGSKFYGWAKQPGKVTVQGELEKVIGEQVLVASRTDRYVHAKNQVISFEVKKKLSKWDIYLLTLKIHQQIPFLKIKKFTKTFNNFQPRFDAKFKIYEYYVDTKNNSKNNDYVFEYGKKINLEKTKKAAKLLIGEKNFASFTGKENYKNYVKNIMDIQINKKGKIIKFIIIGKSFMRFQVRNIVGALLAYDRGKYSFEDFKDLLDNPKKGKVKYKAPGSGLYLKKIVYKE